MVSRRKRWLYYWQRLGLWGQLSIFLVLSLLLAAILYEFRPRPDLGANVFVFLNLNVILLLILAVVVVRNVVKLIFDRRRKLPGSKLRLRLVAAFVSLVFIPTLIVFLLASGLLSQAMEGWFSNQVERNVNGAVRIAQAYYRQQSTELNILSQLIQNFKVSDLEKLKKSLEEFREKNSLHGISLIDSKLQAKIEVESAAAGIVDFEEPPLNLSLLKKAQEGSNSFLLEEANSGLFVRLYVPIAEPSALLNSGYRVLVISRRVNAEIALAIAEVKSSYNEFEQLKLFRQPIWKGYLLTLSLITGLILFAAIWIGFFIARQITVPLQKLAEGTKAVAHGNYDFKLKVSGDDEISTLVRAFNSMTEDLKQTTADAESRRIYIETILANLSVGVIGVDLDERVTILNSAAQRILKVDSFDPRLWLKLEQILPAEARETIYRLISGRRKDVNFKSEAELSLWQDGREIKLQCAVDELLDNNGNFLGILLIIDDITELVKAQQVSAWREAARRIAHEIKNPLTPIQLSAQRLNKLLSDSENSQTISEISSTIVENVSSIKRLADEFSKFARMPDVKLENIDLNKILSDLVAQSSALHSNVIFKYIAANDFPQVKVDPEQIRRAVYNLLDNAVFSCLNEQQPSVTVKLTFDQKWVQIEILDNGAGVSADLRNKIFEPYFTTKDQGTGLGLAIVSAIVDGHHGRISVYQNDPKGSRFVVELPR